METVSGFTGSSIVFLVFLRVSGVTLGKSRGASKSFYVFPDFPRNLETWNLSLVPLVFLFFGVFFAVRPGENKRNQEKFPYISRFPGFPESLETWRLCLVPIVFGLEFGFFFGWVLGFSQGNARGTRGISRYFQMSLETWKPGGFFWFALFFPWGLGFLERFRV